MALRLLAVLIFALFSTAGHSAPGDVEILNEGLKKESDKETDTSKKGHDINSANSSTADNLPSGLSVSQPKNRKKTESKSLEDRRVEIFTYHQSFTFSLGVLNDSGNTDGQMSFQYLLPSESSWRWEAGAQVFQGGFGGFSLGLRKIWNQYGLFRPYIEPTLAINTDGQSGFAEFIEIDNLRAEFYTGSEYLFLAPFSGRIEAGASIGKSTVAIAIRIGLSWAWY